MPDDRVHDVSAMTDSELERARRHLMVSLSLAFPGSPVRGPILAHISAIDAELAERALVSGRVVVNRAASTCPNARLRRFPRKRR